MNLKKTKSISLLMIMYVGTCIMSIIILYKNGLTLNDFNIGMSLTTALTVLSFVLPFIIYFKQQKGQKKQIYFIENEGTFIFNHISFNIDYLNAICKNKETSKNLILYEGTILNTGQLDIDIDSFQKPLKIKLSNGYKWVTFDIKENSEEVSVKSKLKGENLVIEWDLLKPKEYIKFEAIVEFEAEYSEKNIVPILRGILKNISLKGTRGVDLQINKENPVKKESIIEKARLFMSMMMILLIGASVHLLTDSRISQNIITSTNDTIQVISSLSNKKIEYYDSTGVLQNISSNELVNGTIRELKVVSYKKTENIKLVYMLLMSWAAIQIILLSINMYFYKKRVIINDFTAFPYKGNPENRTF